MTVTVAARTMNIAKLSPHVGAEVTGVDLTRPLDAETRRLLNAAIVENVCLVVRDQHFTAEQFLEAVKVFGEPMPQTSMFTSERMMTSSCRCATSSDRTKRERMPACVAAGTAYFF